MYIFALFTIYLCWESLGLKTKLTFGWSRTGTATRTVTFIGLSRVMSIILLFSYGECGMVDGEPENKLFKSLINLFNLN